MKAFCLLVCGIITLLWLVAEIWVFCTNFKKMVDNQREMCYYNDRKGKEIKNGRTNQDQV